MSYGQEAGRSAVNVRENFPLYDTVSIRADIPSGSNEGFASFLALSQQNVIPFFTMRNRSEYGSSITNKDTKDALAYAYDIFSIGVDFYAPLGLAEETKAQAGYTDLQNAIMGLPYLFNDLIRRHCAAILRIREDDKLVSVCDLLAPGYGTIGIWGAPGNNNFGNATQGWPGYGSEHRFAYKSPIKVPRNCVIRVDLEFDNYARKMLAALPMFREYYLGPFDGETGAGTKFASAGHLRVTLMGQREVQQRGELHY